MKKLIGLIFGLMLAGIISAHAASITNMTGQMGVYNSTDATYGLEVDNQNTFKFAQTSAAIYYPGTTATTNTTLTAQQSGQTQVFTGTSGSTKFTLPTAVVGMTYTIVNDTTNSVCVVPQSGDTINFASITAGQSLCDSSTPAKGDSITVFCAVANKWSVDEMRNTWAHGSP